MAINVNFNNEEAINTKVQDLNYIPTYKEYEKERQENEIERQAYYEDFKMRVENGEFKGDTGEGWEQITTDTNIYDLDTGLYSVEEGVSLTYTEMYADDHPPILVSVKSILKVVKKVISEEDAYVYYTLTTLNSEIDPMVQSPIGVYQGSIHLLDFFAIRWYGQKPTFISMKDIQALTTRTTTISSASTNNEIPTAKAVYDLVNSMLNK